MGAATAKKLQESRSPKEQKPVANITPTSEEEAKVGNGKKRDIPIENMTEAAAEALSSDELYDLMVPRISERRALLILSNILEDGTVTITEEETIADWTFKHVVVTGSDLEGITGSKSPVETLSAKAFKELDGPKTATLIRKHTTEKRASQIMLALIKVGLTLTSVQIVSLSNGRIAVAGITVPRTSSGKRKDAVILVKGVQVNGNGK